MYARKSNLIKRIIKTQFKNLNTSGQGIIEIIATIAIAAVLILTVVTLSSKAIQNSNASKDAEVANRLATEGIEIVQNIRRTNAAETATSLQYYPCNDQSYTNPRTGSLNWYYWWNEFYALPFDVDDQINPSNCTLARAEVNSLYGRKAVIHFYRAPPCGDAGFKIHIAQDSSCSYDLVVGSKTFTRILYIADTPTFLPTGCNNTSVFCGKSHCNQNATDYHKIKQFTVVVNWTDSIGDHDVVQSACIPN